MTLCKGHPSVRSAGPGGLSGDRGAVSDVEQGAEGSGEKLLVVDDDPFIARLLEIELAAAGYQVRVANDGQQAMEQLDAGR